MVGSPLGKFEKPCQKEFTKVKSISKGRERVKLFAFDLDGTVLEDGVISKEVQRLFQEFVQKGGVITVATGRPMMRGVDTISEVLRNSGIMPNLEYPQFLISSDTFIYSLENGVYRALVEWNDPIYEKWYGLLSEIRKRLPELKDEFEGLGFRFRLKTSTLEEQKYLGSVAISLSDIKEAKKALQVLRKKLSVIDGIGFRRNRECIGMYCRGTGKGEGLDWVRRKIGVFPQEVLAVGDSQNDLGMLDGRYGFRCATVFNAEYFIKQIVRRKGGYVASKPLSNGICEIMERIVLKK